MTKSATVVLLVQSLSIYLLNAAKPKRGETSTDDKSEVIKAWFNRFQARSDLHNMVVQGKGASAEIYLAEVEKIKENGGRYSVQIK